MTRQTSIEAYYAALASGLLSKNRGEILRVIAHHGPMTANEAFDVLAREKQTRWRFDLNTCARLTELREMDLLDELGTRECSVTKRRVILWGVSGRPARPLPKRRKREDRMKELEAENQALLEENSRLRAELKKLGPQLQLFGT